MKTDPYRYDEIRMLSHRLPRWWLLVFWGSALFAFVYWAFFHIFELGDLKPER